MVKDGESSRKWLENFRNTLQYQDLNDNPEPYAMALLSEARKFNELQLRKQQIRWVRESLKKEGITDPTKEQIETRWAELYGNETTADGDTREDSQAQHDGSAITRNETRAIDALCSSANHYTADGDTREDSQNVTDGSNAARLESRTSANHYGDAATSDGAEAATCRESGTSEPTTISKNIGNGQGTEAPRRQGRAGADPLRGTPLHSAPARSPARRFRNKEEYMQWAIDSGLDATDASECWDATLERGGNDADGNVVKNIKAFAVKWCKTRDMNRRSA